MANNQDALIEIIQGMPEIKLQGSEHKRRWIWAQIQAKLFRVGMRSLTISQMQDGGAQAISQLKDILITFIAARAVVSGTMTLGMMLAVQYIIGQLNAPLQQLVQFVRSGQDARIILERLNEVHNTQNEETDDLPRISQIPAGDILINNVSFRYTPLSPYAPSQVHMTIPRNKVTAIVGASGSGKTTLLKLLLGFYAPTSGQITIGSTNLDQLRTKPWRKHCGVVMQEGYVFSDTIANNICESDESIDTTMLAKAIKIANIQEFIDSMPLRTRTVIDAKGNGISQGQRQRLFIARAVYKDPDFLLFDEATNALDAKNEKVILENLHSFFENRTVVIVAHRLSTVKHADQIIVLDQGRVKEVGTHEELIKMQNIYFNLIKNQLELGES